MWLDEIKDTKKRLKVLDTQEECRAEVEQL